METCSMQCKAWCEIVFGDSNFKESLNKFDVLFTGETVNIDERSTYLVKEFIKTNKQVIGFCVSDNNNEDLLIEICGYAFEAGTFKPIKIDIVEYTRDNDSDFIQDYIQKSILIDMTTFDVPSLAYFINLISRKIAKYSICYLEPSGYKRSELNAENDIYYLSDDGNGLNYVVPFTPPISNNVRDYFISLGYETYRLGGFLQSEEITLNANINVSIGIPAFNLGWENNTIQSNYIFLQQIEKNLKIHTTPADDAIQIFLSLTKVMRTINSEKTLNNIMVLVPLGTKPQALGMIWFAVQHKQDRKVAILYDYVKKINNRTQGIKKIHFWDFIQ